MSFDAHSNFGLSTVASAPSPPSTATSLVVADASTFPAVPFNCTVWPAGVAPTFDNSEIIRVTAMLGTIFTIARAQEGTNAKSIADGWQIANTTTVKVFTDIEAAIVGGSATWGNIVGTLTNQADLVAALAAAASTAVWGNITGTLSNQADLQAALNAKLSGVAWGIITGTLSNQTDLDTALNARLVKAQNLSDVVSASTSFDNIKQAATTAATGVVELATVAEAGLGTDTSRAVFPGGLYPPYATVASGGTTNIGAANTSRVLVSGTTTITAFDNVAEGIVRNLVFSGILTLTHNGTSLILPGAANITTAAGDCCTAVSAGSGNWRVTIYQRASGQPLVASSLTQAALGYAGSVDIDLTGADYQTLTLAGNVTFTTSNKAGPRSKTVVITCDGSNRTPTFPAWVWIGTGAPTVFNASKKYVISLTCLGSNDTDIIAVGSAQNP